VEKGLLYAVPIVGQLSCYVQPTMMLFTVVIHYMTEKSGVDRTLYQSHQRLVFVKKVLNLSP